MIKVHLHQEIGFSHLLADVLSGILIIGAAITLAVPAKLVNR
jgi:hypothetical protein